MTYRIGNEPYMLAAYTCTPLVKVPVSELKAGAHIKGTTIAELGNHNQPLDMIVYQKDGKDYLLMTNSSRGVMKIPTEGAGAPRGSRLACRTTKGWAMRRSPASRGSAVGPARRAAMPSPRERRCGRSGESPDDRVAVIARLRIATLVLACGAISLVEGFAPAGTAAPARRPSSLRRAQSTGSESTHLAWETANG